MCLIYKQCFSLGDVKQEKESCFCLVLEIIFYSEHVCFHNKNLDGTI